MSNEQRTYRVEFKDVGRGHLSWSEVLNTFPDEAALARLVKRKKALCSKGIDCVYDDDEEYGTVVVGGYRPVGSFRVVELVEKPNVSA